LKQKKNKRVEKARKIKNPFLKSIPQFLKANSGKVFKRKDLSQALGVRKSDFHLFQEALKLLGGEGKIAQLKNHHYTANATLGTVEGNLQMTSRGFAFVSDDKLDSDIFIAAANINTAMDGDLVEIRLFADARGKNREGSVNRIIERARTRFVGTYRSTRHYSFVVPDANKINRDFLIHDDDSMNAKDGQKVVVELIKWQRSQLNPEGKVVQILGFPNEKGVDVSSVALDHGLELEFDAALEKAARKMKIALTPAELSKRLDLRDQLVFTVDPPDAKDFDDAISLEILENGHQRLGVHIADVSYFVQEDSPLDKEALDRGTSVYLVDRVIPMLPEFLSNKLCSLQPNEDRLAYSCFMEFDDHLNLVDYLVKPSVINSKRRYTYQEVQDVIDGKSKDKNSDTIRKMHALSRRFREQRSRNGSIDFDTPEVRFILDDKGQPVDIVPVQRMHSNEMIEEFMLLANQTVTKHVYKISPKGKILPFVYRVHEKPDKEKLQKFQDFLRALGHKITLRKNITPSQFQEVLLLLQDSKDAPLIREVALRTMMKAVYSPKNIGHFGLAFEHYTHFTSPIRRYPDLMVHRLLKEYDSPADNRRQQQLVKKLPKICQISSERERQAMEAERESVRIKQIEWISAHRDQLFEGLISGVTSFGIFVETLPFLIEGLIRMDALEDDYYIFDERTYSLTGKDTGRVLRLGDPVKVRISNIDLNRKEVDFVLVEHQSVR